MTILERIFEKKREEVEVAKRLVSLEDLKAVIAGRPKTLGFREALESYPGLALIAEVKRKSPSAGVIREEFDPVDLADRYVSGGAQALSVLTDHEFFGGSPADLQAIRAGHRLPLLRKDFIETEYQVYEARAWGADAFLLIAAWLSLSQIVELIGIGQGLGLDALVEVHNEEEAEIALQAKATLIGVNNRNLNDFKTDLMTSERLLPMLKGSVCVSESALTNRQDVARVELAGAKAVLIGTSLSREGDPAAKISELMGR